MVGIGITYVTTLVAFYYGTNATLAKHDDGIRKLGEDFRGFGETSKQNFEKWMTINKQEQDKADRIAKEDREARDKMREQFMGFTNNLSISLATIKAQVEAGGKQLDAVTTKLEGISNVQQENRRLIGNQGRR